MTSKWKEQVISFLGAISAVFINNCENYDCDANDIPCLDFEEVYYKIVIKKGF